MDMDIKSVFTDIALCGLEGIAQTELWTMLKDKEPPLVKEDDKDMKEFIWQRITKSEHLQFWYFDSKKKDLKKGSKSKQKATRQSKEKFEDPTDDDGGINEISKLPESWIVDVENKIYGYCPNFDKRENITLDVRQESLSHLNFLQKWGNAVFIVATKEFRRRVLFGDGNPPDLKVTPTRYTILEIIGKTRERGFLQKDFRDFSMDPRTSFHHVKVLINMGLVTKQVYNLRRGDKAAGPTTQIRTNILFLKKFHRTVHQDHDTHCEKICQILEAEPGGMIEFGELKNKIGCSKKVFCSVRRNLYSKGCIQYLQNGKVFNFEKGEEKLIHKFHSSIPLYIQLLKQFNTVDGGDVDEDEDSMFMSKCKFTEPQLIQGIPLLQQVYWIIDSAKERGMTIDEFGAIACVPYYMARSFTRQLQRRNLLKIITTDIAKQKVYRFVTTPHVHKSEQFKKITEEIEKSVDYREQTLVAIDSQGKGPESSSKISEQGTSALTTSTEAKFEANESTPEAVQTIEREKGKSKTSLSIRGMRRQNKIFEKIRELKVIEGSNQIYKAVLFSEQELGIKETVCRKSIHRILNRLAETNMIKKYEVEIEEEGQPPKTFVYYCDASITREDQLFKTAVDETKFRIKGIVENKLQRKSKARAEYIADRNSKAPNNMSLMDFVTTEENAQDGDETDTDDEAYEPLTGSGYQRPQYGFLPRFPRIRMLHFYIWQLVYGNEGDVPADDIAELEEHGDSYYIGSFDWVSNLKKLPPNRHGKGYFQTGDVLAIMPLLVFTKCVGICAKSKTLEKMLKHPTKRYTPLRDLPPRLKAKLLRLKKGVGSYVGHFIESLLLLTHMGLLYTTPEKLPTNRTQIVLFVSREAMLLDTTLSEKGYAKTRLPQDVEEFQKQLYRFDGLTSLCKYWKDVQYICLNTRLGLMRALRKPAQDPEGYVEKRPRVYRTSMTLRDFQEHFPTEDPANAVPKLFGDGLGAAGFDSTFFGHLPKNWAYTETRKKQIALLNEKMLIAKNESRNIIPITEFPRRTVSSVAAKANDGGRGKKRKRVFDNKIVNEGMPHKKGKTEETQEAKDAKLKKLTVARLRQKATKPAKVKAKGHKCVKDDVDLAALKRKVSVRVSFSPREDAAILMARVTAGLLELDIKKLNYWVVARNILHKEIPESNDKTTESLGRRARYMLKNSATDHNLKSCILECTSDPDFELKKPSRQGDAWKVAFREVYEKVKKRFQQKLTPVEFQHELPDTLKELEEAFVISKAFDQTSNNNTKAKILTSKDICLCVLEQIVHNSLASQNLKENIPSLVFHVFDRYPPNWLEETLISMKAKSLISRLRLRVPRRRALPIATMTYSLSVNYERIFEMPIANNVFPAARNFLRMLKDGAKHVGRSILGKHHGNASVNYKLKDGAKKKEDGKLNTPDVSSKNAERQEIVEEDVKDSQGTNGKIQGAESTKTGNDEVASSTSAQISPASNPGSLIYSRDESLGGHVAGIFSLVICNKGVMELEIPDDIVEYNQSASQGLGKTDDENKITSVTLLKRKLYSENIEEALEIGKNLKDLEADDDFDDVVGDDDNDDLDEDDARTGDLAEGSLGADTSDTESQPAIEDEVIPPNSKLGPRKSGFEKDGSTLFGGKDNSASKNEKLERSCLKTNRKNKTDGDESAIPKKRRRVTFEDASNKSVTTPLEPREESSTTPDKRAVGTKNKASPKNQRRDLPCAVNFEMSTASGTMSFLSDRSYVSKSNDGKSSKLCKVTEILNLNDERVDATAKSSLAIVPSRSLEIRKTKMHTSRTTLMLHRSLEHESAQSRMVISPDSFIVNPMKITCHSLLQPHLDELSTFERGHLMSSLISSDNENPQGSAAIQRFLERKSTVYCKRDNEKCFDEEGLHDFIAMMKKHFSWNENEVSFAKEVVQSILEAQEIGFTEKDILNVYVKYQGLRAIEEILNMLLNFRILMKVGMNVLRFVTANHAAEWCITTPHRVPKGFDHATGPKGKTMSAGAKESITVERQSVVKNDSSQPNKDDCVKTDLLTENRKPVSEEAQSKTNTGYIMQETSKINKDNKLKEVETTTQKIQDKTAIENLSKEDNTFGEEAIGNDGTNESGSHLKKRGVKLCDKPSVVKRSRGVKEADFVKVREKVEVSHTGRQINNSESKKEEVNEDDNGKTEKSKLIFNQVVCRPWFKLNSEYNTVVLRKFQRSVLSLVMMCPGITESSIHGQFRTVMTRVTVKDILLFLEISGCVTRHPSPTKKEIRAFDPPASLTDLEFSDDDPYFIPTANCVLNLADVS